MASQAQNTSALQHNGNLLHRSGIWKGSPRAVIGLTALLWLFAILAGLILHTDLTREELAEVRKTIPFLQYDLLLRRYGGLVPFLPFALRWWGAALGKPGKRSSPASQFAEAGVLYTGLSLARLFVYVLHVSGVLHAVLGLFGAPPAAGKFEAGHVMSDHLLLGASMTAILATEAGLALSDLKLALKHQGQEMFTLLCIASALLLSTVLCISTIVDMFYTARYFHGAKEVFGALFLGYLLFQAPMAYWLLRQGPQKQSPGRALRNRVD